MHEHGFHYLVAAFPFFILAFIALSKIRFVTGIRLFAVVTLTAFIFLHIAPYASVFAHHHQSQSESSYHPCCIPQTTIATESFIVSPIFEIAKLPIEPKPIVYQQVTASVYFSRAPPVTI